MTHRLNLLTDVTGIGVGHADDLSLATGVTAIACIPPMCAAAHCCGGAPATRETALLGQDGLVNNIDAVMLCGGSAFGLAAADGALEVLEKHGRGFQTSAGRVPIVPAAALFDLFETTTKRPDYRTLGRLALERALTNESRTFALGNAGAGRGARAGTLKGGVGSASTTFSNDQGAITTGALAVVNAFGSPVYPDLSALRAWWLERNDEFGGFAPENNKNRAERKEDTSPPSSALLTKKASLREHTTLCLVAFDCALPKAALKRIAQASTSALAIALHPSPTLFDGDIIFVLARPPSPSDPPPSPVFLQACEQQAVETLARAIAKGVWYGESTASAQSFRDARRQKRPNDYPTKNC